MVASDSLDLALALSQARSAEALSRVLLRVVDDIGASACSLLYFDSNSHGAPLFEIAHWPERLTQEYADLESGMKDPVMQHLRLRTSPIAWGRKTYESAEQVHKWELYADHGVASGVDIALHVSPSRHFVLGFGWADHIAPSDVAIARVAQVQTLAVFAEPTAYTIASVSGAKAPTEALSDRELCCLRSAAAGNTDQLTASMLRLSPRTVHTHISEAIRKLGAGNRIQAAVIAAAMGLLD